ncbi:MAG TPA: hypothetical protein VKU85_18940, partial [bacterium]|nr:hypothetical protein [bacterium]
CRSRGRIAAGLDDVVRAADRDARGTLLVEDDYHLRGSVRKTNGPSMVTPDVDVRDSIDDAVDAVIERVLGSEGHVVFLPTGTLGDGERIVLLHRDETRGV